MSVPTWKRGESKKTDLFVASQEFALYILRITQNEKIFKPEYRTISEKLTIDAMNIHRYLWLANNTKLGDELRSTYQQYALSSCTSFLVTWNLAERAFHLRSKRVQYAIKQVKDIVDTTRKWIKSDADRLKESEHRE